MRSMLVLAAATLFSASPAKAEVTASSEAGFVTRHEAQVAAAPMDLWKMAVAPAQWWNGDHTYSGNAANMAIDAAPGGCFCETIPDGTSTPAGAIEHMRVLYAAPGTVLRLSGALGPLQSEAVTGVLTITFEPAGEGTLMVWEYVVGGYSRLPAERTAQLVDAVVGEQFQRLVDRAATGQPSGG
jgi:uncharacterized protein YndB with AHSA1/START domain